MTDDSDDHATSDPAHEPEEKVGYGRPPKKHQFKKGVSGNLKGRPKGVKNEATILRDILSRLISIRENNVRKQVPVMHGILLKCTEDALRGNLKSAAFLLNRYSVLGGTLDAMEEDLALSEARETATGEKAMELYRQRIENMRIEYTQGLRRK